jgi:hypothetical protein
MDETRYLEWLFSAYQPKQFCEPHDVADLHRSGPIESLDVAVIQPVEFWTGDPSMLAVQSTSQQPGTYCLLDAKCIIVPLYSPGTQLCAIRVDAAAVTAVYSATSLTASNTLETQAVSRLKAIVLSGVYARSDLLALWLDRLAKPITRRVVTSKTPDYQQTHVRLFDELVLAAYREYSVERFVPLRPSAGSIDDLDGRFRASSDATLLERDAYNVLGLMPGRYTRLMSFRVYFYDLKNMNYPLNTDPGKQENSFRGTSIAQACRWSISDNYFAKCVKSSELMLMAIADMDGSSLPVALTLASREKDDVFINLVCSADFGVDLPRLEKGKTKWTTVSVRVGQLFQLAIFNYTANHWGARNAYNSAASIELIPFYAKTGWTIRVSDPALLRGFAECTSDDDKMAYVEQLILSGKYGKDTYKSYPMELINFDLPALVQELVTFLHDRARKYKELGINLYDNSIFSLA